MTTRYRLAGLLIAVLALVGCTADPPRQPDRRDDPPASRSAEPLADRDRTAVLAALRELDICELLLAASDGLVAPPPGTEPSFVFPANCVLGTDSSGVTTIGIQILDLWPQPIAYDSGERRRALGGATAFVDGTQPNECVVDLPVSPTTSIEVRATDSDATTSPCALAEPVAAAVAETLDDPGQVRAAARWDPCDAVRTAHGGQPDQYEEVSDLAICTHTASGTTFAFRSGKPGASGSEAPGAEPWRAERVAGVRVWFSDNPTKASCHAQWEAGQLGSPYSISASDVLVAEVGAKSCADAMALIEPLVGVLGQPPPDQAPQRPVLYPA
ncbi:hypothetical protein [Actinophytocola sediminis]